MVLSGVVGSFRARLAVARYRRVGSVSPALVIVVIIAAILPARRALRISPTIALRTD